MSQGIYEKPEEFQDEDKWIYLTKRQWAIILPVVVFDFSVISFIVAFDLTFFLPLVIILLALLLIADIVVAFFDVPQNWYLFGGGMKIERVLFRLIRKKLPKNRKIYTKHYDNGYREW